MPGTRRRSVRALKPFSSARVVMIFSALLGPMPGMVWRVLASARFRLTCGGLPDWSGSCWAWAMPTPRVLKVTTAIRVFRVARRVVRRVMWLVWFFMVVSDVS